MDYPENGRRAAAGRTSRRKRGQAPFSALLEIHISASGWAEKGACSLFRPRERSRKGSPEIDRDNDVEDLRADALVLGHAGGEVLAGVLQVVVPELGVGAEGLAGARLQRFAGAVAQGQVLVRSLQDGDQGGGDG